MPNEKPFRIYLQILCVTWHISMKIVKKLSKRYVTDRKDFSFSINVTFLRHWPISYLNYILGKNAAEERTGGQVIIRLVKVSQSIGL